MWCGPAGGPAPAGLGPQDAVWDWAGEQLPSKREQQLVHLLPLLTDQAVYVLAGDLLQLTHLTSLLGQAGPPRSLANYKSKISVLIKFRPSQSCPVEV